ncbi:MAG: DUF2931 family protein [Chryseobacterium sp.]|jgi:hypothetical protein|uniref:DUF2931 family protein n=1 Tax=Chryseobacterium sp. TaxID=1871047 RepID=UPI00283A6316|nr:DUF2931 family protein [Chryseobacterium sp.]MDR2237058.1 DUF2931 family protein [Chryseobacterium sp.]
MTKSTALYLFLFLSFLHSCNKENKTNTGSFPYSVTFSTATGYASEVHEGYLADDKRKLICGVPKSGTEDGPWQYDGTPGGQGGDIAPSYLSLTYASYAEKKFYHVEGDLPKEKILAAFRKGFKIKGNEAENGEVPWVDGTYDQITIGAAPGGVVVVWLAGNHHRTEICRLQAKEIFVNKDEFRPNPKPDENQTQFFDTKFNIYVPDSLKTSIEKNGIPYGLWDKYREKYNYRFRLHPYDEKDTFDQIYRINYNGESEYLIGAKAAEVYKSDAIPYNVTFMMQKYNAEIEFNDTELMNTFKNLKEKHTGKPIDIVLVPSFMYKDIKVYAECDGEKIELKKFLVKRIWGG